MPLQWLLPGWAWPLLLLAAVACVLWSRRIYATTTPAPSPGVRRLLLSLRVAACLLVLAALARPLLVVQRDHQDRAVVAIVLEDSGSMALVDSPPQPSRWQQAVMLAAEVDSALALASEHCEVVVMRGNGRNALRETDLASAVIDTPRAVGSDLAFLVSQTQQQLLARPLRGIVVLTDGHSDDTRITVGVSGVPIWFVGIGDLVGPPDRRIVDLRYPDVVHEREPLVIEVLVGQEAVGTTVEDSLVVRLWHEGDIVNEMAGRAADVTRWELRWTPQEAGLAVLDVEVVPFVNERFRANNRTTIAVDVQKERARLLLLGATAGWDGRFLAQAALFEPRVSLSIVRVGPSGPVFADSLTAWRAPLTAADWSRDWDGVILAGPPGELLPDGGDALSRAVADGVGLLMIGVSAGSGPATRFWTSPLAAVAPVTGVDEAPRFGEYPVVCSGDARVHPLLADLNAAFSESSLPPLRALMPVRPRSGAEMLLTSGGRPVLVAGDPRQGRVLWFGGSPLWELAFWQRSGGDPVAETLGRRLLRRMAVWTALGDQAGGVTLLGQRMVVEEGEPLDVAVRWRDLRGDAVVGHGVSVEVSGNGQPGRQYGLVPDPTRPGVSVGSLPPLAPGRWDLVPRGDGDPEVVGAARQIVVTRTEREHKQVRQDRRTLRQIAARLEGVAFDSSVQEDRDRLLADLGNLDLRPDRTPQWSRYELMAGWGWLGAVTALLGAEWLIRRRRGLL